MPNTNSKLLLATLAVLLSVAALAQPAVEWSYNYGGSSFEEITAIVQAPDGGFLAVGHTASSNSGSITSNNAGSLDILAVRMSNSGVKLWERLIGSTDEDRAYDVIVDQQNRFVITGLSRGGMDGTKTVDRDGPASYAPDVYVICLDQAGNSIWQSTIGGNGLHLGRKLIQLDNGHYLIAAETNAVPSMWGKRALPLTSGPDPDSARFDYWLIELNEQGTFVREHIYGGSNNDRIWGLKQLADKTVVLYGESRSPASGVKSRDSFGANDMWLVHVNPDGSIITDYQFGGSEVEVPFFLTQFNNGDIFVSGQSTSPPSGNKSSPALGELDLWCVRLEQGTGQIVWDRTFGGADIDDAYTGRKNINDYIVLAGTTRSAVRGDSVSMINGRDDGWMIYISPAGELIWDITRGGDNSENIRALIRSEDGAWYIGGESNSGPFDWRDASAGGPYGELFNGVRANDGWLAKLACDFTVDLGADTVNTCLGEEITLRNMDASNLPHTTYLWSDGSTESTYTTTPVDDQMVVLESVSLDACEAIDTAYIHVHTRPALDELIVEPGNCAGDGTGSLYIEPSIDAGTFILNGTEYTAPTLFENLSSGDYTIQIVSSLARCSVDTTVTLQPVNDFTINLGGDQEHVLGSIITLDPQPSTAEPLSYLWSGPAGICEDCERPSFRLLSSGEVSVTATNDEGCSQSSQLFITGIEDKRVGVPNAMSPNFDGINDRFGVYLSPYVESAGPLRIFDRWGNLVFVGLGEQMTSADGWDGTVRGKPVQAGVYTYILPVVYLNGEESVIQGEVTLMR